MGCGQTVDILAGSHTGSTRHSLGCRLWTAPQISISAAVILSVLRHGVKFKKHLYPCSRHSEKLVKERQVGWGEDGFGKTVRMKYPMEQGKVSQCEINVSRKLTVHNTRII